MFKIEVGHRTVFTQELFFVLVKDEAAELKAYFDNYSDAKEIAVKMLEAVPEADQIIPTLKSPLPKPTHSPLLILTAIFKKLVNDKEKEGDSE